MSNRKRKSRRLPPAQVFLDETVFITMVCAAAEAYRRECYGVLLGDTRRGRTYIRAAFAYQTARRTPKSVDLVDGRRRVIRQVLPSFPRYNYIGEFHSHPGYGRERGETGISPEDLRGTRPGEYELIVAVNRRKYSFPWQYCADGSLSGSAGRFGIRIRAYRAVEMKKGGVRASPVHLRCAYAVKTASSPRLLREQQKKNHGP